MAMMLLNIRFKIKFLRRAYSKVGFIPSTRALSPNEFCSSGTLGDKSFLSW